MISKYFLWTSVLVVNLLLFSSCLNSTTEEVEYSPDAQIYAFSLSSKADTSSLLSATQFTIDQINGKIFNKEPLPYQFQVDSVVLTINGASTYSPFSQIMLKLVEPDSSYAWIHSDSVAMNRLQKITTTAPDGKTTKSYQFEMNIYQQDPYILTWENKKTNYLPTPVASQKTITFNNRFITYFTSGTEIKAMSTSATDGVNWTAANLTGLPFTILLSSITASQDAVYALDTTTSTIYRTVDGINWNPVVTPYRVKAIYGELPSAADGNMLIAVDYNGTLTFAATNNFTVMTRMNNVPENIPVKDFSVAIVDVTTSYSLKSIIVAGGMKANNTRNGDIWILQEKEGIITLIPSRIPATLSLNGNSLFFYDNKPYLLTVSAGKNILMYSDNYGLDWIAAGDNQAFPADFKQRTAASVITDADNYIWIFGGISVTQTQLVEVWKGRLNKFSGM